MNGEPDPLAPSIEQALATGWRLIPQIGARGCVNALAWFGSGWTYLLTIPPQGRSTVVYLDGGPGRGQPRQPGREEWRHRVPIDLALQWVLDGPADDHELAAWQDEQGGHR